MHDDACPRGVRKHVHITAAAAAALSCRLQIKGNRGRKPPRCPLSPRLPKPPRNDGLLAPFFSNPNGWRQRLLLASTYVSRVKGTLVKSVTCTYVKNYRILVFRYTCLVLFQRRFVVAIRGGIIPGKCNSSTYVS